MILRPFFPFYGSKWRTALRYAAPRHGRLVEPFCGSAGYATYYNPRRVELYDADPQIVGVWQYLLAASAHEIRVLPNVEVGQDVFTLSVCQEAKWLIGFWTNRGSVRPKRTLTDWGERHGRAELMWGPRARARLASQVDHIRHWTVAELDYSKVPLGPASWFVDPPYQVAGQHYRKHAVDYEELALWCRMLEGQVIVCEGAGADWLPFDSIGKAKAMNGSCAELVWTSDRERLF